MIRLTKDIIAVEVPSDSTVKELTVTDNNRKQILDACTDKSKDIKVLVGNMSLIGVTPLSEEQWKEVVDSKQIGDMTEPRWRDHQYGEFILYGLKTATESGVSLLKSKGLDVNKKYAIIKMEK